MTIETKSHVEQINQRFDNEKKLINSGAVFSVLEAQILPISAVAIASELNISVPLVKSALRELEIDGLAKKTLLEDWVSCQEIEF